MQLITERTLGWTKGRWRVILKCLDEDHKRIWGSVITCCILHNICILRNKELDLGSGDSDDEQDNNNYPGIKHDMSKTVQRLFPK